MPMKDLIRKLMRRPRTVVCSHKFLLKDLALTGIPQPLKPESKWNYDAWAKYNNELYNGESFTKRVKWPCRKCGKVFYAHCGLDISPHYGPIVAEPEEVPQCR